MTAGLEVRDLALRFGNSPGLDHLSFEVKPGERLIILGASGAGKTSLLRAVAGLLPLTAGRVLVAGRDVTDEPPERRDAVYLHQTPLLFSHLSVFENVAFALRVRGAAAGVIAATVGALLKSVQLAGSEHRRPHTLSGGQRHRVALARAMAAKPAVLLLDEPLASLDPLLREEVRTALFTLQAEYQPAVVLVTHDLDEASALGHRIGVLLEGRLAQVATPEILFRYPASVAVARFLGIPNAVPGRITGGTFESSIGGFRIGGATPDGRVVAVFGTDALRSDVNGTVQGNVMAIRHGPARILATVQSADVVLTYAPPPDAIPLPGDLVHLALDPLQVTLCTEAADA